MNERTNRNDLQDILSQALESMKREMGKSFDPQNPNLAELQRRTGLSRSKLRTLKQKGFLVTPHGRTGMRATTTVLSGFTGVLDELLRKGVTNSVVCYERLVEQGYSGSHSSVKNYLRAHKELIPPKRQIVASQGSRGRRYTTAPGECHQMDWGFTDVEKADGTTYRVACFAMICHHCGERYIEFFPNAKQENLFIGMIHAFAALGIPAYVLTDNMKSVVIKRSQEGRPIWQKDYQAFMEAIGFKTRLCKPRHPFTKGSVERLIQFVKGNFLAGRVCSNITELNHQAQRWAGEQNGRYHRAVDCIPDKEHHLRCLAAARILEVTIPILFYLSPLRKISFDGFVNYEGRRFGVPYWYTEAFCRVRRDSFTLYLYSADLSSTLVEHNVTWSRKDSFCKDQYIVQPEETATAPVTTRIKQLEETPPPPAFRKFDFSGGACHE